MICAPIYAVPTPKSWYIVHIEEYPPMFSRFLLLFVNMDQIQCETVTYHTVQSNLIWYTCNVPFTLCKGVESSTIESSKEGASSLAERSLVVKCVGVIWFLFHALQLLPVRFTQQNSCCSSRSTTKHMQKSYWKSHCFNYVFVDFLVRCICLPKCVHQWV